MRKSTAAIAIRCLDPKVKNLTIRYMHFLMFSPQTGQSVPTAKSESDLGQILVLTRKQVVALHNADIRNAHRAGNL